MKLLVRSAVAEPTISAPKTKGESIYDESLRLGEEEEREKKRAEKKQSYGPSF